MKRTAMMTEKRDGSVRGVREDGSAASFAQERIGRVYSPIYRMREDDIERAFEEGDTNLKDWCWVGPGSEAQVVSALKQALVPRG